MSRRVPEAAIVVGVLFASTWLVFPLLVGEFAVLTEPMAVLGYVGVAALLCYPFAAYTLLVADAPDETVPPRPVFAAGTLAGFVLAGVGVLGGVPLLGLLVGLVVAVPPAAYALAYRVIRPPPGPTLAAGGLLGLACVGTGLVLARTTLAGVVALLAFAPAVVAYDRLARNRLPTRTVLGSVALAVLAVAGLGFVLGRTPEAVLTAALTVGFGGMVAARFVAETPGRR
ncbi:hypothetical protein [Haloarchaeobius sp. TZWWS8]|uniref:hypothetical protein n=1 Tax=Haloarchaeobius sp. TZWWS8 TaxID=3446121 RepID=UPI003EBD29D6